MSRRVVLLIALFGVCLILAGGAVVSSMLRTSLAAQPAPTPPPPLTEQVVVARADLPLGAVLQEADLMQVEVPLEMAPPDAVRAVEQAAGRITKIPLVSGETLMAHHLADPTNLNHDLAFTLTDDQVLMAFPADDLLSSLNLVQRGDLVDILVSFQVEVPKDEVGLLTDGGEEDETETFLFTFDALQRVEISAVVMEIIGHEEAAGTPVRANTGENIEGTEGTEGATQTRATRQAEPTPPKAVLLALSPQDALVLKHLKDDGGIVDIVLRAPTSERLFELTPVMPEYLIDRYQLVDPEAR